MSKNDANYEIERGNLDGAVDALVGDDFMRPSRVYTRNNGPDTGYRQRGSRRPAYDSECGDPQELNFD